MRICAALLGSLALAVPVAAHIVIAAPKAIAGSYHVTQFRVGHGCDGAATRSVRVEIPAAIIGAKPQPKPGWKLSIERQPLAAPIAGEGGRTITDRVSAVTWEGTLDPEQFDEFGIQVKLPATPGTLYFPTTQRCDTATVAWTDIPAPGQAWGSVPHPAPVIETTAAPTTAHQH